MTDAQWKASATRARERHSLADAICDLLPAADAALRAEVREEWGEASDVEIDRALTRMLRDGVVVRVGGEYVPGLA